MCKLVLFRTSVHILSPKVLLWLVYIFIEYIGFLWLFFSFIERFFMKSKSQLAGPAQAEGIQLHILELLFFQKDIARICESFKSEKK